MTAVSTDGRRVADAARRPGGYEVWLPWGLAAGMAALYAFYSLVRHRTMHTAGNDLGIFTQAVRAYANLEAPDVPIKGPGFNLLGDHFHPILVLLAPFYRIWPSAQTLLVAQAVLAAISIVPVGRLALRRLGARAGTAVTVAYALSFGVQGLIGYDFHEVAFAVPLVAFALCALAEERWRTAIAWTLPLLLVKEDLGLTVAAIGCYLCLRRQWRYGLAVLVAGALGTILAVGVVIPALNSDGRYPYWGQVGGEGNLLHKLVTLPVEIMHPAGKPLLVLTLLGVTAGAALRSPILLVAVPSLLARLATDNPYYWSTGAVQYNAILMPVVFVALIEAIPRLRESPHAVLRGHGRLAAPAALAVALVLLPQFSFASLVRPGFYDGAHAAAARHVIRQVPDGASVSVSNYLVPQLVDRAHVTVFPRFREPVDWVLVDTTRMYGVPAPKEQQEAALRALPAQGFRLVDQRGGVVLYRRG